MHLAAGGQAGAPQGFAVDGYHCPVAARPGGCRRCPRPQPAGQNSAEQGRVEAGQQPPHRRAGGHAPGEPEPLLVLLVEVVQPVDDRGKRGGTGQDPADRDGQQRHEGIPGPVEITRVRDPAQGFDEPGMFTIGDRR